MRWCTELAAAIAVIICATFAFRGLSAYNAQPNEAAEAVITSAAGDFVFYKASTADSGGAVLFASDSSADDEILSDTSYWLDAATGETDELSLASMKQAPANDLAHFASVEAKSSNVNAAIDTIRALVGNYADAYIESENLTSSISAGGVIRVKNDHLDAFMDDINKAFPSAEITVETVDVNTIHRDVSKQIDDAYALVDELNLKLYSAKDDNEVAALKTQIENAYDVIYEYENAVRLSQKDIEYATVRYIITDSAKALAAAETMHFSGGFGGFMSDVLKVMLIILPTALITAIITLHVSSAKKRKVAR